HVPVNFITGGVAFPKPQAVLGGIPFGWQAARASRGSFALVALDRPDRAGDKSRLGRDVIQPGHGAKRFHRLPPRGLVARGGVLESHRGQIVRSVAAVVVADLAQPAVLFAGPIELVDKTKPL